MGGVANRVALVTGAGSETGIGFAIAKLLKAAGAQVAISSTTDRIHERCEELGGSKSGVFASPADLTEADAVAGLAAEVEKTLGPIDILINNAGMVQIESSEGMVLATLSKGEMFGEMASILGERERTARAVALKPAVIHVIDSKTMQRQLVEADPVLRALVRNLTIRLAVANELNERQ